MEEILNQVKENSREIQEEELVGLSTDIILKLSDEFGGNAKHMLTVICMVLEGTLEPLESKYKVRVINGLIAALKDTKKKEKE